MANVFSQVADALASLLGTTSELAGFILGFVTIAVFLIVITWALGPDSMRGLGIFIAAGTAFIFVVLVGWFPLWTVLFLVVIIIASKLFTSQAQSEMPIG